MEVVAGMIQRLVDENATRKLDQEDYRRKYVGYADRYAALESRMDGLKQEGERREIQHDLFSGFLSGLEEVRELPVGFSEKLFHRMVDYATVHSDGRWCSPSATGRKSARRFESRERLEHRDCTRCPDRFFSAWKWHIG